MTDELAGVKRIGKSPQLQRANETRELETLRAQIADAAAWIRCIGEEMVLAGYPGGDRVVILSNIRMMKLELCDAITALTREDADVITLRAQNAELLAALRGLLYVISVDDLVPETVGYMVHARAVIAKAEDKS